MSTGERPAAAAGPHPGADEREHRLYASHRIALFLDVDGTLLQIADAPDRVRVEDRTVDLLARARDATCGALALITGRSIADTDRLFAPLALPVAGQHGFERRDAAGVLHGRAAEWAPLVASARAELDAWARRHPGVLIEDKGSSLAVHYRLATEAGPLARVQVEAIARRSAGALVVQPGRMVWELRPAGRDKGTAIAEFMQEPPFLGRLPVFLGDDATDELGFEIVNRLGGMSVKVGAGSTRARLRLRGVEAARNWLVEALTAGVRHDG